MSRTLPRRILPIRQHGMALVIVLWLIVLLSVIAVGHASNVHSETRLAMQHLESARARVLAEAGIQRAILELLLPGSGSDWPVNGSPKRLAIDDREVTVAIRDATGLVDLNAADAGLLAALIATTGDDSSQQEKLVDAILDWRDSDNLTHLHGAEDDAYLAAGLPWTARDSAFSSVDELRYVFGMTAKRFATIRPYITVYSERGGLNLEYAPPFLISMLTGDNENSMPPQGQRVRSRTSARNGNYHIYASASGNAQLSVSVEAVVNISAASEQPYSVLYWREPARLQFPVQDKDDI